MFADDASIFSSYSNIKDLLEIAKKEIKNVFPWCSMNKLSLNADKTKYISFHKQRDEDNIPFHLADLKINKICLKRVKYLGENA